MKKAIYFDTNCLLDLYAYPRKIIKDILLGIDNLEKEYELIVPSQVYAEFIENYNRIRHINSKKNPFVDYGNKLDESKSNIFKNIENLKNSSLSKMYSLNLSENIDKITKIVEKELEEITLKISDSKAKQEIGFEVQDVDPVLEFVKLHKSIYQLNIKKKIELSNNARTREFLNFKPGLTDGKNKLSDYSIHGDVYIWYEILETSKNYDEIIFIENENKADWWEQKNGKNFDPFLLEEIAEYNNQIEFKAFHFNDFFNIYLRPEKVQHESSVFICQLTEKFDKLQNSDILKDNILNNVRNHVEDNYEFLWGEEVEYGNIGSDCSLLELTDLKIDNKEFDVNLAENIFSVEINFSFSIEGEINIEYDKETNPKSAFATIKGSNSAVFKYKISNEINSVRLISYEYSVLEWEIKLYA